MEKVKIGRTCDPHRLSEKLYGRDDLTVQLKCLNCGQIVSVDSRDYDEEMYRQAEDDVNFDETEEDEEE